MLAPNPERPLLDTERRPMAALVRQIADDVTLLARSEVRLAKAEVKENAGKLARPVMLIAAAALLGIAALFTLMGALVGFLTPLVGAGFAALIVAVVAGLIAFALYSAGTGGLKAATLAPKRTARSVRTNVEAVKESVG